MSASVASSTECHYDCCNKQSLWPQAKHNISKLKSPNQYFHYLHYKFSINGSSLGKAPSFSPCTSEGCCGLTAGTAGCTAIKESVFLRKGWETCWFWASEGEKGRKQGSSQSSFPLSFGRSGKIRNRSWQTTHLLCKLLAGMKRIGTFPLKRRECTGSTFFLLLQTRST